jgi:hypothetical protein
MSLDIITDKLLQSIKDEITKEKNKKYIENEILEPIILSIVTHPYFIGSGIFFMSMFLFIMIILILNIRIFYKNAHST